MISTFSPLHFQLWLPTGDQTQAGTDSASRCCPRRGQELILVHAQAFDIILPLFQSGKALDRAYNIVFLLHFTSKTGPALRRPAVDKPLIPSGGWAVPWLEKRPAPGGPAPERRYPAPRALTICRVGRRRLPRSGARGPAASRRLEAREGPPCRHVARGRRRLRGAEGHGWTEVTR